MKYCLVGPMRNIPNRNTEAFTEATVRLRQKGYEVVSPLEIAVSGLEANEAHKRALRATMEADALILLPGWGRSEGSKAEVLLAVMFGKPLYAYHQHRPEFLEELKNVKVITRAEVLGG